MNKKRGIGVAIITVLTPIALYVWRGDLRKAIFHPPSRQNEPNTPTPEHSKQAAKHIYLTVRLRPDVQPETLRYLSQVTEPVVLPAKSGTALDSLLTEHYGTGIYPGPAKSALRELLLAANPGAFTSGETPRLVTDSVKFPVGPKATGTFTQAIQFSGTLRQLVQLTMGNNGRITEGSVLEANPELEGKWDLPISGTINLPYTTAYASYVMRMSSLNEAQSVVDELKSMKDEAVISAEAGYGFEPVPFWTVSSAPSPLVSHGITPPLKWPFNDLPDKLEGLEQVRSPRWAVIGIVDTGIAGGMEKVFPLWENDVVGEATEEGDLSTRCRNDYYGCNFLKPTAPPLDDCAIPDEYHHGTHIAGLVSGRLYAGKDELNKLVKLMILKAADETAEIQPDNLQNALVYAVRHGANIVNLSLTGTSSSAIAMTIGAAPNVLFISAAGNPSSGAPADLSDPNVKADTGFPARLSRTYENVIGVAAHNTVGQLSGFSNYGRDSIDLAAPGEDIPSLVNQTEQRLANGTSQATALVTLTAGILYSQGIMMPQHIKHRILASTDFKSDLRGKVTTEGVLNVRKALQFKEDLVQFKDRHIETGELNTPTKLPVVTEDGYTVTVYLRSGLYKIIPHYSDEQGKEIRVTFLRNGKLVNGYTSNLGIISFKSGDTTRAISPDDIIDIVPKLGGAGGGAQ
ncbi:MAG TPA: S8 family serine peptidase [Candidatus Sulfotelmatobacter sp.]|nr:S8 family serine peptidase [Candidatus Sulfotelmatobacter sp.]